MVRFFSGCRRQMLLLLFCIALSSYLQAQTQFIKDSLNIKSLAKQANDSTYENPEKAMGYTNEIIRLAEKNNYTRGLTIAYNLIGNIYQRQSQWSKAIEYFTKCIELSRLKNFPKDLSSSLYNLASLYSNLSNNEKALEYVNEALTIKIKLADTLGISRCYRQLGQCMYFKKDFKKADSYFEQSLALLRKVNNVNALSTTLNNYSVILIEEKKYKEALQLLYEVKSIYDDNEIEEGLDDFGINAGLCNDYLGRKDSAFYYYNFALKYAVKYEAYMKQATIYNNLGELYFQINDFPKAKENYLKSLKLAQETNDLEDTRESQKNMSLLYEKQGDYKQALQYNKDFEASTDSLYNEQKTKAIEEVAIKYETKQIDEKNKFLVSENTIVKLQNKQKNHYILSIILAAIITAVVAWVLFKKKQIDNMNKTNALRQKLLISQMNPHFIFNSIDNIQSLIYNKQDETAIMYLTKFSKLTRQILENASEDYILLTDEIAMLENYIEIQKLLFGNNFTYRVTAVDINTDNILVPPMLAQPFIENAIKHGLKNKKSGGLIEIRFFMKADQLHFEVSDNGEGIKTGISREGHKSMAINIVKERLKQKSESILTKNRVDESNNIAGAVCTFEMPYINN